ncbi:uncharacterized protein LOC124442910 isoform X1 [Xenia sp. Carnegie-2017]|uniref:uncharacterized protein LOC124442910 isoform X1 n=1 Tax=Xenia sp. Carnegie-2017 TaxID=2897299 RepID=UPI001F03DB54|nr:uncharacterized protein LOC124442910 isoform X1 [Xenia sp. Carnegie-2017]
MAKYGLSATSRKDNWIKRSVTASRLNKDKERLNTLKSIKPRIYQEVHKNKEEEEYRVRRRITRVLDEERRQEVIAKQNQKFLVRLLDIMGSPSRLDTWNIEYMNKQNILAERKLRENDQYITKTKKSTMKKRRKIHLPALQ